MNAEAGFEIEVDGERFVVRRSTTSAGGFDFDWVSGPNPGYGFSMGALVDGAAGAAPDHSVPSEDIFVDQARIFLSMIDPATGFVAD